MSIFLPRTLYTYLYLTYASLVTNMHRYRLLTIYILPMHLLKQTCVGKCTFYAYLYLTYASLDTTIGTHSIPIYILPMHILKQTLVHRQTIYTY